MKLYDTWKEKLETLHAIYSKLNEAELKQSEETESLKSIQALEKELNITIPPGMKEVLTHYSKEVYFNGSLPDDLEFDEEELEDIESSYLAWSLDVLKNSELERRNWVSTCFSDTEDEYDLVWHNKLAFLSIPNGDCIAFDLAGSKEDKRVVYLSHDDGDGHGCILADNFIEFIDHLISIGACGPEDYQLLPFITDSVNGIDPNCENAIAYRNFLQETGIIF